MSTALHAILDAREERDRQRRFLLERFSLPLVCFSLNIPGPDKNPPEAPAIYQAGWDAISAAMPRAGIRTAHAEQKQSLIGPYALIAAHGDPLALKMLSTSIEDSHPLGRLMDVDVYRPDGSQVSRSDLGRPPRACLLCDRPAAECSRSRAHPLDQLLARVRAVVSSYSP